MARSSRGAGEGFGGAPPGAWPKASRGALDAGPPADAVMEDTLGQPGGVSAPHRAGMVIGGKFVLLRVIAKGAMGVVYEAKDTLIQRHVAIKMLHPELNRNPDFVRRFRREAEATASVLHPNVVTIHEMGQRRDGSFYIVQELLTGVDLRSRLAERGRLRLDEALDVLLPVMGALSAAHTVGIVHRDVKPDNIVLARSPSGEVVPKLIDFGVARVNASQASLKMTQVGALLGTISYMSPEQVKAQHPIDARADVWGVGVVLFELLSGACPYEGPNDPTIMLKIVKGPPPRLEEAVEGIPERLAAIMRRALEPDLARRFPTMQVFRDELLDLSGGRRHPATVSPPEAAFVGASPPPRTSSIPPRPGPRRSSRPGAPRPASYAQHPDHDEQWLDPDDLEIIEDGPGQREESSTSRPRAAALAGEMEFDFDRTAELPRLRPMAPEAAEQALSVNKLREAITLAAQALIAVDPAGEVAGRMLLVQAIAQRWLGAYEAAESCARSATQRLERGTGGWYAALGYRVIAAGCLGKSDELLACFEEVKHIEVTEDRRSLHAILLCRLAIFLLRSGLPNVAHRVSLDAEDLVGEDEAVDSIVRAWLDAARAEVAMHRGDLATYLRRVESAVESFTVRGDVRNACLQRANIGNAYMQLGAYRRAVTVMEEALRVAEPMELDLVAPMKVNLGFALARQDQVDRGIQVEEAALEHCVRQNYKRFEGCARIYLATMHLLRGDVDKAATVARQALDGLEGGSALRAYALGTLARVMLVQRQAALSLRYAQEAMDLLSSLGGVEEGESLIRAVYALALQATGNEAEGRRQIVEARRRLLERAGRINEARFRRGFLEGVPDNAWAMSLAAEWVGPEGSA